MTSEQKLAEERKREAAADPAQRWQQIQAMIAWAQEQLPPEQRRNRPREFPSAIPTPNSAIK
jgi:hypothetical protein